MKTPWYYYTDFKNNIKSNILERSEVRSCLEYLVIEHRMKFDYISDRLDDRELSNEPIHFTDRRCASQTDLIFTNPEKVLCFAQLGTSLPHPIEIMILCLRFASYKCSIEADLTDSSLR